MKRLAKRTILFLLFCLLFQHVAFTQGVAKGRISSEYGVPITGAIVTVEGATNEVMSDSIGSFELNNVPLNGLLRISHIGFQEQTITYTGQSFFWIALFKNEVILDDQLPMGYGAVAKDDITGAIATILEKDFNKGVATSPTQLISGKVAGVQIIQNGGRAGSGASIRIRGGASLLSFNDPLIVLDGMPLDGGGIAGFSDVLSTINSNDIESMNILKDASAAAIYGSRAANGVIILNTKKGQKAGPLRINFSTLNAVSSNSRKADVMDAATFREFVTMNPFSSSKYIDYLGDASTNWQKEIYRSAFISDNNVSISGRAGNNLPFRVSVGYIRNDGTLKTDDMKRGTASITLSPTFFDNHLSVLVNLKGTYSESQFGNMDAIGAAICFDPTQPVKADGFDAFNGYFTWLNDNQQPNTFATYNPVALLNSRINKGIVTRIIGNVQLDYKFHFLPELRATLNIGYDNMKGKEKNNHLLWAPNTYAQGGERSRFEQDKISGLIEFYLNYVKHISESRIDVMAGYSYQDWIKKDYNCNVTNYNRDNVLSYTVFPKHIAPTLLSAYTRLNFTMMEKYLLSATVRRDGYSRFNTNNRWGTFPSAALAWKVNEENFMENFGALSNLKLRLSYGSTGRQEIVDYEYLLRFAQVDKEIPDYRIEDEIMRTSEYDNKRKWEVTGTSNFGLDFGFFDNRLSGSIDFYHKNTRNLLHFIEWPTDGYFDNLAVKNIGSMINKGFEVGLNFAAISQSDLQWDFGFNIARNNSKITKLTWDDGADLNHIGIASGRITGGSDNRVQMNAVGHARNAFYLYKQLYDSDGMPIEGAYADLKNDDVIDERDKYFVHKPDPDVILGFNTSLRWQQWTASTSLRASIGNYVYNNTNAEIGNYSHVLNPNNSLANTVFDVNKTHFYNTNPMSDHYLSNASFLKMDYLHISYLFERIESKIDLSLNLTLQNVFTITKYKGVEPEVIGGIEGNFYPNPRIISLGLNVLF